MLTDTKNRPSANALMAKVIANLNRMIQTVPTVVLAARYPERLNDELVIRWMDNYLAYNHIYEACKQHMRDTDVIVYADRVNAPNHTLMHQAVLFLSPQWFHQMTTSMCQEYVCIHDMHNSCKAVAFEKAHYAHCVAHGLSEDDNVFLASLEPWLQISPNGTIIPDWEVPTDKADEEMADEDLHWGSDDGEEAEGVTDKQVQAGHDFYTPDLGELGICNVSWVQEYASCLGIGAVNKPPLSEARVSVIRAAGVCYFMVTGVIRPVHVPSIGGKVVTKSPLKQSGLKV
ncbi:hypothetical protein IW261DRAFT_1418431 [Armillaria novae-zelandiae]|uniref:Uncharacterized protein n=1 Tax=Armillaria novae-zelandiae TaxID=153914 RepID=A0AA39PC61_9AGAR|nr:hypothetical protein IW261DRAFT_1418431 [Armillaria novae-zelandiae]